VKNNREEGNARRKFQESSGATQTSATKADGIRKDGARKKGRPGRLSRSVTASQQK
jgi:hypothetical protein